MKQIFGLLLILSLFSCDNTDDNNPFLPIFPVNFTINLNLAEGINLIHDGNQEIFLDQGIRGIIVKRFSATNFVAFDLACPHIELQNCSTMTVEGSILICLCDDERFQILDGASVSGNVNVTARNYNAILNGNILRISN